MRYTKAERIDIGRQIAEHKISKPMAEEKYQISRTSAENYVRLYQESIGKSVPEKKPAQKISASSDTLEKYMAMSKEELIDELILAKANELRAKKGYEVKGAGANKEFIPLNNKNSKS